VLSLLGRQRRLLVLGSVLGVATVVSSCSSERSDRRPGPAEQVAVGGRTFSVTREPTEVCVHAPSRSLPSCASLDLPLSEAVFGALLDPLDAAADLLVVVTRLDASLDGLPPGAVRAVTAPDEPGGAKLAVWLALPPAGTPRVCASVHGLPPSEGFQVYRTQETPPDGVAEVAVDEC